MTIRTFQPGDELAQAGLFNAAACPLPGFKPAQADDVKRRTRARGFDPAARFFAVFMGSSQRVAQSLPGQPLPIQSRLPI